MERRFASIRDYIVARQQRRLDATAAIDDDNDIVVAVPTLPVEEDVVVTASELSPDDMMRLRLNDPWMYHSIVNKITGHTVCNFDRIQSEDGDAAAGRPSSINGNQTSSFRLAASNSTRARNDVHRRRRFSTEESTLPDPASLFNSTSLGAGDPVAAAHEFVLEGRLNQDGSSSLGAEEAVTAARPAVPVGRLNQDEDSNGSPLDLYLSTLFHLNFQGKEEDEVDELSAS
jgi:hypothetical protein